MKTQKRRGFLAKAGALLAVAALALSASPSYAQDPLGVIPEKSNVVITKLVQPDEAGEAATGESRTDTGNDGIPGVSFEAYEVPLGDLAEGTNKWQEAIAAMELNTAKELVNEEDPAETGETDADGRVSWANVPWGLYLIRETETPSGVIPAEDFLLAVPMTNPEGNGWLTEINVYPKGAAVTGEKTVENATTYEVGKPVIWTISADIPRIRDHNSDDLLAADRFEIVDTFNTSELELVNDDKAVNVTLPNGLTKGVDGNGDYNVTVVDKDDTTTVTITFTEEGRSKLLAALEDDTEEVTVTLNTNVLTVGEITTKATVYSSADERAEKGLALTDQTVKYGNTTLVKKDTNGEPAKGAVFRVYSDKDSALAKNNSFLKTLENPEGEWVTDDKGEVVLEGFRFSDFANGETQSGTEGSLYQTYWLVETKAPADQQLLAEPISFTITNVNGEDTVEVTNTANTNAFVLPLTGGTGTAMLTILGLGILAIVLFVARSRRNAEA